MESFVQGLSAQVIAILQKSKILQDSEQENYQGSFIVGQEQNQVKDEIKEENVEETSEFQKKEEEKCQNESSQFTLTSIKDCSKQQIQDSLKLNDLMQKQLIQVQKENSELKVLKNIFNLENNCFKRSIQSQNQQIEDLDKQKYWLITQIQQLNDGLSQYKNNNQQPERDQEYVEQNHQERNSSKHTKNKKTEENKSKKSSQKTKTKGQSSKSSQDKEDYKYSKLRKKKKTF